MRFLPLSVVFFCFTSFSIGCRCEADLAQVERPVQEGSSEKLTSKAKDALEEDPVFLPVQPLLRLDHSAFHTQLAATRDTIFLLAAPGVYTLERGSAPKLWPVDYHGAIALTDTHLVYYAEGGLIRLDLVNKSKVTMSSLSRPPRSIAYANGQVAWLARTDTGEYQISIPRDLEEHVLYESSALMTGLTIAGERLFFVEGSQPGEKDRGFTIKSLPFDGGEPSTSRRKRGRTPAELVAGQQLFFYHGPERRVYRLGFDFAAEEVIASDQICSPMFVHKALYCYHVSGLSQINLADRKVTPILNNLKGTVTNIHVSAAGLLWVADAGTNQLELSLLPFKTMDETLPDP